MSSTVELPLEALFLCVHVKASQLSTVSIKHGGSPPKHIPWVPPRLHLPQPRQVGAKDLLGTLVAVRVAEEHLVLALVVSGGVKARSPGECGSALAGPGGGGVFGGGVLWYPTRVDEPSRRQPFLVMLGERVVRSGTYM